MSAAPTTASSAQDRAQRDPEGARLLGLLRTLQALAPARLPMDIARRFRCLDLTLIIARVTRGLLIAEALEARLLRRRPRLASPAPTSRPTAIRAPSATRPTRRTDADDDAELQGALPTVDQIAARIRRRPIGAVFVDICRDLGLNTSHPDWREIQKAIVFNGGNMVTMLRHWTRHLPALERQLAQRGTVTPTPTARLPCPGLAAPAPNPAATPVPTPVAPTTGTSARPEAAAGFPVPLIPDLLSSTALTSSVVPTTGVSWDDPAGGRLFSAPVSRIPATGVVPRTSLPRSVGATHGADPPARAMSRLAALVSDPRRAAGFVAPIMASALPP